MDSPASAISVAGSGEATPDEEDGGLEQEERDTLEDASELVALSELPNSKSGSLVVRSLLLLAVRLACTKEVLIIYKIKHKVHSKKAVWMQSCRTIFY